MDPSVIRSASNPAVDSLPLDTNFEIADLPVKLELRYAIESKRAANGLECPKTEYKQTSKKEEVSSKTQTSSLGLCEGALKSGTEKARNVSWGCLRGTPFLNMEES